MPGKTHSSRREQPGARGNRWQRACLLLVAAAALAPPMLASASMPVAGQSRVEEFKFDAAKLDWQELRRDDLGFRVEMPAKPEILVEEPARGPFAKETTAEVEFDVASFQVKVGEQPRMGPLDGPAVLDARGDIIQKVMQGSGYSRFTMNGCPGREDRVAHADGFRATFRAVVCGGRLIQIAVTWQSRDDTSAAAERFLHSFSLLPAAR